MLRAEGQGRPARTVELFGWLILVEGAVILLASQFVATLLGLPVLEAQAEGYFRLVADWILFKDTKVDVQGPVVYSGKAATAAPTPQ